MRRLIILTFSLLAILTLLMSCGGKGVESYDPGKEYEVIIRYSHQWFVFNTAGYALKDSIPEPENSFIQGGPYFFNSGNCAYILAAVRDTNYYGFRMEVWETTWPPTRTLRKYYFDDLYDDAFLLSPDQTCMYSNYRLVDLNKGKPEYMLDFSFPNFPDKEFFIPTKEKFCYYLYSGEIVCIDYSGGGWQQTSYSILDIHDQADEVMSICVSPDGEVCYASIYGKGVYALSTTDFKVIEVLPFSGNNDFNWSSIRYMSVSPDGTKLYFTAISSNYRAALFSYSFGKKEVTELLDYDEDDGGILVRSYILSPEGDDIFLNTLEGPVRYNIPSDRLTQLYIPGRFLAISGISFRPLD